MLARLTLPILACLWLATAAQAQSTQAPACVSETDPLGCEQAQENLAPEMLRLLSAYPHGGQAQEGTAYRMAVAQPERAFALIALANRSNPEQMAAIGQVAAGVAHEIRNPLTSIKGLVQVNLREAVARGLPIEDLRVIDHEVRRMERTLQTFLDFARPPRPDRRRLDVTVVVDRVYALVGGRARKQGVILRCPRPDDAIWLDGDQDQLQQLLLNLVLNALDAMPAGGAVEIDFRPPLDGYVEILVRDTGPGITIDILPKVFETFVSSKETGLGLGLPLSRRIAEDHGGTLTAFNLPGKGACFALRLPTAA